MKFNHIVLAVALSVPGIAWSAQCDEDLLKADEAVDAGPKVTVTAEDFELARNLIGEAASLLASGDDVGCVVVIGQALELLDVAETE